MATLIGSSTIGGSSDFFGSGDAFGSLWTCVASGNLEQVTLYDPGVSSGFTSLRVGVYADSAGVPGALLGSSDALTSNLGTTKVLTFSTPVALTSGTSYWLIVLPLGGNFTTELAPTGGYVGKGGHASLPSPWDATGNSNNGSGGAIAALGEGTLAGSAPPAVAAVVEGGLTATGTNLAVTLPGGGSATDLYLVIIAKGSGANTINALAGWTEVLDENVASGLAVIYYTGGGVPSNPTFVQSATSRSVWAAYRITGADLSIAPQVGTTATGTSTTPNPPSVTVTGGPKDVLAIACFSMTGAVEVDDTDILVTTFPTNYTLGQVEKTGGLSGTNLSGGLGAAARQLSAASSEDPGTFTQNASRGWRAQTIVVHPAAAAPAATPRLLASTGVGK